MKAQELLRSINMPSGDNLNLPSSQKTFVDGANYRIEVPTINSLEALESLLNNAVHKNININRVTETRGLFLHTAAEIKEWVRCATDYGCDLFMSIGPRAVYDTSATVNTRDGFRIGYRLRGQNQIAYAIEEILRAVDLGVSNFLIYDEGLLFVLQKLKENNKISSNIKLKISAHCGHANPAAIKMLEDIGANSVNPVRDLQLSMISAIREVVDIPLDIHSDNPKSSGGFIRFYEVAEIIRIASPVYIKVGNSAIESHGSLTKKADAVNIIRNIEIVMEMIARYNSEAFQTKVVRG